MNIIVVAAEQPTGGTFFSLCELKWVDMKQFFFLGFVSSCSILGFTSTNADGMCVSNGGGCSELRVNDEHRKRREFRSMCQV